MLTEKMIRAAKLEPALYEEVEADVTATNQALQVVVIASLAGGIGGGLSSLFAGGGLGGLVIGLVLQKPHQSRVLLIGQHQGLRLDFRPLIPRNTQEDDITNIMSGISDLGFQSVQLPILALHKSAHLAPLDLRLPDLGLQLTNLDHQLINLCLQV